jgi:drug/metabolite transporter (DMT)-like permease
MKRNRSRAVAALIAAGLLWGTTVPLSKVALAWLPPAWLTFARFGVACAILLAVSRPGIKAVFRPAVLVSGAIGYGGSVLLQNAGITRTSVSHAALLIGAVPVLVALMSALWHRTVARPLAWAGFAVSLAGVGLVTVVHGGGAGAAGGAAFGDGLVLASVLLSAGLMVAQPRVLRDRDPVAVTAVQFLGAAAGVLPVAACSGGLPATSAASVTTVLATLALAVAGTLAPFTLFAFGQKGMPAEVAGAFVNIEPVVGAVAGIVIFGDPAGPGQVAGGVAILAGIAMSTWPALNPGRSRAVGISGGAGRVVATGQRPPSLAAGLAVARRAWPGGTRRCRRSVRRSTWGCHARSALRARSWLARGGRAPALTAGRRPSRAARPTPRSPPPGQPGRRARPRSRAGQQGR